MYSIIDWIFFGLFSWCILLLLVKIYFSIFHPQFRYGKNPYRRWCNSCGQQQELWDWNVEKINNPWWEDAGKIYDESCKCHRHSKHVPFGALPGIFYFAKR